jgi:hypothetical protein
VGTVGAAPNSEFGFHPGLRDVGVGVISLRMFLYQYLNVPGL